MSFCGGCGFSDGARPRNIGTVAEAGDQVKKWKIGDTVGVSGFAPKERRRCYARVPSLTDPRDLRIETWNDVEFVINLMTAKELGLRFHPVRWREQIK